MKKNDKNNEEIQMKFLLIGEQAVGKSSLINQYIEGKFEENLLCAAGLDLKKKIIKINDKSVKLMIYDSAGHERFDLNGNGTIEFNEFYEFINFLVAEKGYSL